MQANTDNLRHPLERPLFVLFATLNVIILIAASFIALQSANWLSTHPILAKYNNHLRALATAIVLGPILVTLLRNSRRAQILSNSVAISPRQLPELHQILVGQCKRIGLDPIPELYFSDRVKSPSQAHKSWRKDYIVLGTTFLQPDLKPVLPVFAFLIGRELGRIQLGHTRWGHELLLSYVEKVPYVKSPLIRVLTYSEDRWGAFLAPEGLLALVAMAAGRRSLGSLDVAEYLRHVQAFGGIWAYLAEIIAEQPSIADRIKALVQAGLYSFESNTKTSEIGLSGAALSSAASAGVSGPKSEQQGPS